MNAPRAMGWILVGLLAWPLAATADVLRFMHTDLQGNVVAVTDESGAIIERRVYEPYGLPTAPIADGPGYTGHDMDGETGLVYMQQRYYDPEIGRFLSVDPVGVSPAMGSNFNRYWYANNNPYRYVDPEGLLPCPNGQSECTKRDDKTPRRENRSSAESRWNRANLHRQTFSDVPSGGWTVKKVQEQRIRAPSLLSLTTTSAFRRDTDTADAINEGVGFRNITAPTLIAGFTGPGAVAGSVVIGHSGQALAVVVWHSPVSRGLLMSGCLFASSGACLPTRFGPPDLYLRHIQGIYYVNRGAYLEAVRRLTPWLYP